MKAQKKKIFFTHVMELLMKGEVITNEEMAKNLNVSEKTMRTKITEINTYLLDQELGEILKKPRVGIWYEGNHDQKLMLTSILYGNDQPNQMTLTNQQSSDERLSQVLTYIFKNRRKEVITIQKLANELYLSKPTIFTTLKECKLWLKKYNITLENHRTKGVIIYFEENGYRRAVQQLILEGTGIKNIDKNILELLPGVRVDHIKKAILEAENEWSFEFVDDSFYEILVYCCVAVSRGNKGTIVIDEDDVNTLKRYNEYEFAKTIMKHLNESCHIVFSEDEVCLLAIQILCSKFLENDLSINSNQVIKIFDDKLIAFIDEMIYMCSNILGIDLTSDQTLKDSLIIHMRSTLFRMKYSTLATNSLIYYIKKQYKHVFRAMWSLSILFEQYFDCSITEDELGFICLYVQAAIDRKKTKMRNVLIVSTHSRSTNQLLVQKILRVAAGHVSVDVVAFHDFNITDFKEVDVILTTKPLRVKDARIMELKDIISDDWVNDLFRFFNEHKVAVKDNVSTFDAECHQLFDPDLISLHVEAQTKEEVIELLTSKLVKKGVVTKHYLETVMLREEATTTEIGNGIALPHGDQRLVNKTRVAIAILSEPIMWNKEEVDIVFLLAIKMNTQDESIRVQKFYKQYIRLVETEEKIQTLKTYATSIELYNYLIR